MAKATSKGSTIPIKPVNEYYDNTMLSDYKTCPRKYYLRHIKAWRGQGISVALKFGLAWHAAQNIIWTHYGKLSDSKLVDLAMTEWWTCWTGEDMPGPDEWTLEHENQYTPRTPGIAKEMLTHYVKARASTLSAAKVEFAERPFAVPVFPDNPNVWYIGRMDKQILLNGDRVLIEHKTTSEYKKDGYFKTSYLEGWSPNSQCEGYLFQSKMGKEPARYVWIDAALVHKTVHEGFKIIPIAASTASLDAFLWEMRDWVMRIKSENDRLKQQDDKTTHMNAFPKNTESCSGKYGLCGYISVCRSIARPDKLTEPPEGFIEEKWVPFDVLKMEEIGMKK